ncbi:MAG: hypothetical protein PHC30_00340 [Lentisphaeria bacterium]|nr:hypothetical protein [Lentisphaeria bacterium]
MSSSCRRILLFVCPVVMLTGCLSGSVALSGAGDGVIAGRRAYRQQVADPATRAQAIRAGLHSADPLIRKNALYETIADRGEAGIADFEHLTRDQDPLVQGLLLDFVKKIGDPQLRTRLARDIGAHAADPGVQKTVNRMISTFDFFRPNVRLKDNPTWDHEIETVQTMTLPDDAWKIIADPTEDGHEKKFFAVAYDDRDWQPVRVGGWEHQGLGAYDGVAWYRIRFTAPPKGQANAAELHFGAVDEVAWVWLNGTYVSQHDLGTDGWDIPFALDVTPEIKWGEENLLVVRVYDSAQQGGIWKPVVLHVLK